MKRYLLSTVALCAMGVGAMAADLPYRAAPPVYAPPLFTWSGFYIGVNGGYGFNDRDTLTLRALDAGTAAFWGPAIAAGALPTVYSTKPEGFIGGGQIGWNYQFTPGSGFVVGLEADFQGSDIRDRLTVVTNTPGFVQGTFNVKSDLNWLGTARGRIGYAFDRFLVYGTGGVAFGGLHHTISAAFPGTADFFVGRRNDTEVGWTAGGGIEWAFAPNWSAKVEYLYYDLDRTNFQTVGFGRAAAIAASNFNVSADHSGHIVRAGLNYRFSWDYAPPPPPPPVVRKY
jgi:outer membrane immunogenic protein